MLVLCSLVEHFNLALTSLGFCYFTADVINETLEANASTVSAIRRQLRNYFVILVEIW